MFPFQFGVSAFDVLAFDVLAFGVLGFGVRNAGNKRIYILAYLIQRLDVFGIWIHLAALRIMSRARVAVYVP